MIDRHLAERWPDLCAAHCPYLFAATKTQSHTAGNDLSERIKKRIRREIKLEMNTHLFRHLAVKLLLDVHPDAYEAARQFLGHSSVSHTISVYSGLETISATKAFAEIVDNLRGEEP